MGVSTLARTDGVNANIAGSHFEGDRARKAEDAALARAVVGGNGNPVQPGDARHVHDRSGPECDTASLEARPLLDLTSGYVTQAAARLPKQAAKKPWLIQQNYVLDWMTMKLGGIEDRILKFGPRFPSTRGDVPEGVVTASKSSPASSAFDQESTL